MKSKNFKEKFFRLVFLFCGLTTAHLGVTLFLLADLGADPFNVFVQGQVLILCCKTEATIFHMNSLITAEPKIKKAPDQPAVLIFSFRKTAEQKTEMTGSR